MRLTERGQNPLSYMVAGGMNSPRGRCQSNKSGPSCGQMPSAGEMQVLSRCFGRVLILGGEGCPLSGKLLIYLVVFVVA